jgi:hypothetical protein
MNPIANKSVHPALTFGLSCLIALALSLSAARAGLTFTVDLIRYDQGNSYRFYTPLHTNSTSPAAPLGMYFISSPFYSAEQTTSGSWRQMEVTAAGVTDIAGVENPYPDFQAIMNQITNGTWTLLFTNATTPTFTPSR